MWVPGHGALWMQAPDDWPKHAENLLIGRKLRRNLYCTFWDPPVVTLEQVRLLMNLRIHSRTENPCRVQIENRKTTELHP